MNRRKPTIKPRDVQGAKYLGQIIDLLRPLHDQRPDPKRLLHYDELCAWLILYFFSPILTSLRGLQQASTLEQVCRKLALPRFSLGSFSEAAAVFDPQRLVPIMEQISAQLPDSGADPRLRALERRPTAVDGTLLRALPQMVWALWLDEHHRAAKLHLQLDLLQGAPLRATVTEAQASESAQLKGQLQPGRLYITDRGYCDYDLLAAILESQSSFVARVRDNSSCEPLGEPRPISPEAARAGVVLDQLVQVGSKNHKSLLGRPLRLVRLELAGRALQPERRATCGGARAGLERPARQTDYSVVLLTDLLDVEVELIALLYRYRWQIELFFRWFKKVLQADRLLAMSENGLTTVTYCALIASMLVVLWTGRKPTKRTYEMLCFYFYGLASDEELREHLSRLEPAEPKN